MNKRIIKEHSEREYVNSPELGNEIEDPHCLLNLKLTHKDCLARTIKSLQSSCYKNSMHTSEINANVNYIHAKILKAT